MRMRLTNRELEMTDEENASVFGPQFHRVFNNNKNIDWPVLEDIKKRDVREEIDHPTSWGEIIKPTKTLSNDKSPGPKDVPPNTFKTLDDVNLS